MKLSKFPVTSPAGNEYRVTIIEDHERFFGPYYSAILYEERRGWLAKLFRFKRLYSYEYDIKSTNFIAIASEVVLKYESEYAARVAKDTAASALAERKRHTAAEFAAWDGVITKANEEGENGSR
ncbi:hypothetical protein ACX93W_01845 [Paenibacillus sp. CAU 1782]